MTRLELLSLLDTFDDDLDEVLLQDDEGVQWDFTIEATDDVFSGFDTVYPAHLVIKKK